MTKRGVMDLAMRLYRAASSDALRAEYPRGNELAKAAIEQILRERGERL